MYSKRNLPSEGALDKKARLTTSLSEVDAQNNLTLLESEVLCSEANQPSELAVKTMPITIKLKTLPISKNDVDKTSSNENSGASVGLNSVFQEESSSEDELPSIAKWRMRNVGKETPTSAGPHSYGKTSKGFESLKMWKTKAEELDKSVGKANNST